MPENRGRTVHEQTARMVPDTDATPYASALFALGPRYFLTEAWLTNTPIAPAMKNAGTRHSSTCSRAYHFTSSNASRSALSNRGTPSGSQYAAAKSARMPRGGFHSFFRSISTLRDSGTAGGAGFEGNPGIHVGPPADDRLDALYKGEHARALQPVVDAGTALLVGDEPGVAENREMPRCGGGIDAEEVGELVHAMLPLDQRLDDTEPAGA